MLLQLAIHIHLQNVFTYNNCKGIEFLYKLTVYFQYNIQRNSSNIKIY